MKNKKILFIVIPLLCVILSFVIVLLVQHLNKEQTQLPPPITESNTDVDNSDDTTKQEEQTSPKIDIPPKYILSTEIMKQNDKYIAITYDGEDENGNKIITDYMYFIPPNEIETPMECDDVWITTDSNKTPINAFYVRLITCKENELKDSVSKILDEIFKNLQFPEDTFSKYFTNVATGDIYVPESSPWNTNIVEKIKNGYDLTLTRFIDNKTININFIFEAIDDNFEIEYSVQITYNQGNLTN